MQLAWTSIYVLHNNKNTNNNNNNNKNKYTNKTHVNKGEELVSITIYSSVSDDVYVHKSKVLHSSTFNQNNIKTYDVLLCPDIKAVCIIVT